MSNWTEERVAELESIVGGESPVSQDTVATAAEALQVSNRSVSAKLRKMGVEVEPVSARPKTFSEEDEAALIDFLSANAGAYTYAEVAANFAGGKFTPRQVQGKVLSLELTEAVKPTPPKESVKTYTEAEEAKFLSLVANGAFLEDIAEALGKSLASVRGKALSLSRTEGIDIPKQRESHAAVKVDPLEALGDISNMTVAEIAEQIGKTERGVKVMITHRGLECADYKAKKSKKNAD